jgi:hypothetical protein
MARLGALAAAFCAVAALLWAGPATAVAAGLSGQVTNGAAAPLEGIEVCAESRGPLGSAACARTDSQGEYSIPSAGAGYFVHFYTHDNSAPSYAPQWYPGKHFSEEAEPVAEADVAQVDATMGPGGAVSGRVYNVRNNQPIEAVEVCPVATVFRDHEITYCAHTDANGKYALRGLAAAEYRFEFNTSGNVNFVEETSPALPITTGGEKILEAGLVPGVMVRGTLTEAGTGVPVGGLGAPYSTPTICALDAGTEERIKCTYPDLDGHYSLPGLPSGELFGIAFALDVVEEGLDLNPDGYVRRYWNEVPAWDEATLMLGGGGVTIAGRDATLTRGAEVFPDCEVASACPPPDSDGQSPPPPFAGTIPGGAVPAVPPPLLQPEVHCKKGYLKIERIAKTRCVKIHKKKKHKHRRHHKARHQRQTADRNR